MLEEVAEKELEHFQKKQERNYQQQIKDGVKRASNNY